jgi:carbamoyl-phosphate synthase large subunit
MPKRTDIKKILLIGSGPIVIGQACEFDYSGTQACKALREEGYSVVLVNSNPATIMTDPETADRTYIEPITWQVVEKIIEKERPDALLPTLGGQTALNTAMDLVKHGVLEKYGVEMIGARADVIDKAEDRQKFKDAMIKIGLGVPKSVVVHSLAEAYVALERVGLPCVLRPSFTMGGSGGGIAYNREEFIDIITKGLDLSPTHEVLVEESVIGWKEYELEVVRDKADNVIIICSIENLDPMGVHTGDSITVAPAQTLSDKEYQRMRDAAKAVIREIGVETGGSNIQFATNPADGRMIVIEMNPRVSRSSALASKATGFPIAKIAAKLAVGFTLDELQNDITSPRGGTAPGAAGAPFLSACFEPTIDYVVTKVPRFAFEKFPEANAVLTTQMKSVGETMAIGRTFKESLQKALRGLEVGRFGLGCDKRDRWGTTRQPPHEELTHKLATPNSERIWYVRYAFKAGMTVEDIHARTKIDPWFLRAIQELVKIEDDLVACGSIDNVTPALLLTAKQAGFVDRQLANLLDCSPTEVRDLRKRWGIEAVFKSVDTCAAEFEAFTPYYYSTYETPVAREGGAAQLEDEVRPATGKPRIMILGGGPNRIGQGIEFDYCCVQAAFALRGAGYEVIMVNSNPETVSTDYDTSDHLFFEPLTVEDVLNIHDRMKPEGTIVQFGGQTPLNLAKALEMNGVPIIGTSVENIEVAEDRGKFARLITDLGMKQPANGTAVERAEAVRVARRIGFPVLVRPSFVLGGRDMKIVYTEDELTTYMTRVEPDLSPQRPVLIDQFLENATEVDVDCLSDGHRTVIGGVMQHIEEAGIHSGDSACVIPPHSLPAAVIDEIKVQARKLAVALKVKGLMNIQFAVPAPNADGTQDVYILEANPRASRTVPFVSKATGVPLARLAALVMVGKTLDELKVADEVVPKHFSIKESVFPFNKFPGVDIILGPEMKSTGEVMGIDDSMPMAFAKSQMAANAPLPSSGTVFISVAERDKKAVLPIARTFAEMGFRLIATRGTARMLVQNGVAVEEVPKIAEGRPNLIDFMKNGQVALIINTPSGRGSSSDEGKIRAEAVTNRVTCITTLSAAQAAAEACRALKERELTVVALQDRFPVRAKG